MRGWQSFRRTKYEAELDRDFGREVASLPGGEKLFHCIQCGTCTGMCPLSSYMGYTPRRVIAMTREGFKEEVLRSFTIWLCASCYACTVECPKQIKITDIMCALKQKAIEEKVYPKRFPIPVLAREFFNSVLRTGRNNEFWLTLQFYWDTNPFNLFKEAVTGWRLWRTGRISPKPEGIRDKRQLRRILAVLEKGNRTAQAKTGIATGGVL